MEAFGETPGMALRAQSNQAGVDTLAWLLVMARGVLGSMQLPFPASNDDSHARPAVCGVRAGTVPGPRAVILACGSGTPGGSEWRNEEEKPTAPALSLTRSPFCQGRTVACVPPEEESATSPPETAHLTRGPG